MIARRPWLGISSAKCRKESDTPQPSVACRVHAWLADQLAGGLVRRRRPHRCVSCGRVTWHRHAAVSRAVARPTFSDFLDVACHKNAVRDAYRR